MERIHFKKQTNVKKIKISYVDLLMAQQALKFTSIHFDRNKRKYIGDKYRSTLKKIRKIKAIPTEERKNYIIVFI